MAFVEGETLKQRLQRGPMSVREALEVATQVGRGLRKAHSAGIVHRDIKPANVMLTVDGEVKIVDFGIAKLMDQTAPTRVGTAMGTVGYMAPEQVTGATIDQRTDIWAVGVLLYEMLAGRTPFGGDSESAILHNIVQTTPAHITSLRGDVPRDVERSIEQMLAKRPESRFADANEMLEDLARHGTGAQASRLVNGRHSSRKVVLASTIALVAASVVVTVLLLGQRTDTAQLDSLIAEAGEFVEKDDYVAALDRVNRAEQVIEDDPRVIELLSRVAIERPISSTPEGADVFFKSPSDPQSDWTTVGRTPISKARLPVGMLRWKVERSGFTAREFIEPSSTLPPSVMLDSPDAVPPDMLLLRTPTLALTLWGLDFTKRIAAPDYLIDKFEVTNQQYKEFVDAGGYSRREFWTDPFLEDNVPVSWDGAMAMFRDRTGRPGPATWEAGSYLAGQGNYPVSGVSWYEAAAYARFRGKSLPTVYHWLRGATTGANAQAAFILPLSNLEGHGLAPTGQFAGVSAAGAFDTAGNVREWCWNEATGIHERYVLGGSWLDATHQFLHPDTRPPFDRSEANGFRLVKYLDGTPPATLSASIESSARNFANRQPVSDDVFAALKSAYAYDPKQLDAKIESTDTATDWIRETVSFTAAYGDERLSAVLFLPKNAAPPYQVVIYAPGGNAIQTKATDTRENSNMSFLMQSGRAVIYPTYKGTYGRNTGQNSVWPNATRAYEEWMIQVVNDARRSLDYLATRPDIQQDRVAFLGNSWGSFFGTRIIAIEPRIKAAVLIAGGVQGDPTAPAVDTFNFVPRIHVPLLMVNGDSDYIFPVESSQKPQFALLGTPADQKRHVVLHSGHGVMGEQRSQAVREILDWLDKYLGAVPLHVSGS